MTQLLITRKQMVTLLDPIHFPFLKKTHFLFWLDTVVPELILCLSVHMWSSVLSGMNPFHGPGAPCCCLWDPGCPIVPCLTLPNPVWVHLLVNAVTGCFQHSPLDSMTFLHQYDCRSPAAEIIFSRQHVGTHDPLQ